MIILFVESTASTPSHYLKCVGIYVNYQRCSCRE